MAPGSPETAYLPTTAVMAKACSQVFGGSLLPFLPQIVRAKLEVGGGTGQQWGPLLGAEACQLRQRSGRKCQG